MIIVSENGGDLILTKEFQTYKQAKNLKLRVCRKADPESKGKIENVVGFIKNNFAKHREFHNLDSWNEQALEWLNRTGNAKVHNTTKKRPVEVFALEKQHLKPISNVSNVPNNNNNSITRSIRKDNTIRYLSNRYSLPLGSFHKYKEVFIAITEEQELIIYCPDGELLAKHKISLEKGKLIQDRNHTRDRTKGIDAFISTIVSHFEDRELAYSYLVKLREKYPRYIRDQLQLLLKFIKANTSSVINLALYECTKKKLYSASDFSDVIEYLKRQRPGNDTGTDNDDQVKQQQPSPMFSSWVLDTNAQKREMNQYYSILEGDSR